MTIEVGKKIPDTTFKILGEDGMKDVTTKDVFAGKKVVLFSVPGAYTPTCSNSHLPGFVQNSGALKEKGVDSIVCLAVNDPFVMKAWGESKGAKAITMLPDWDASFSKGLGIDIDASGAGLGTRGKRALFVINDGVVESAQVEESNSEVTVTSAESCLSHL